MFYIFQMNHNNFLPPGNAQQWYSSSTQNPPPHIYTNFPPNVLANKQNFMIHQPSLQVSLPPEPYSPQQVEARFKYKNKTAHSSSMNSSGQNFHLSPSAKSKFCKQSNFQNAPPSMPANYQERSLETANFRNNSKVWASGIFSQNTNDESSIKPLSAFKPQPLKQNFFNAEHNQSSQSFEKGPQFVAETDGDRRKREIMEIKKQLDEINKKMCGNSKDEKNSNNTNENKPRASRNQMICQSAIFEKGSSSGPNLEFSKQYTPSYGEASNLPSLDQLYSQKESLGFYNKHNFHCVENFGSNYQNTTYNKRQQANSARHPEYKSSNHSPYAQNPSVEKIKTNLHLNDASFSEPQSANVQPAKFHMSFARKQKPCEYETTANQENDQQKISFKKKKQANVPINENVSDGSLRKDKASDLHQTRVFSREDFLIGKKMGKGQFGQVLLVQHKATGFLCGMKVMEKKQIRDEGYVGQIARELSIQFYLSHRNILPLFGYFSDADNVYLLIEFCPGGQLLEKLRSERRMNQRDVALIIKQVCEGIDYIHRELIIHRDIKPQNILFNHGVAKISDFGWAVYRGFGMRKTMSGSPLYYPPEIVKGEEYDDKIDVWNIGMMAYECLLGKIPFRIYCEMDLDRIVSDEITFPEYVDVTDEAKDFILKTMRKKGEERLEIRQMLRHPFILRHQESQLENSILIDFKQVLS